MAALKKSNQEILSTYPEPHFAPKVIRMGMDEKTRVTVSARLNKNRVFLFAAATVFALALCVPMMKSSIKMSGNKPYIGVKGSGHHQIRLYKQDGAKAVLLQNGETAKENDLVQIAYTPGPYNYGVIFSVDGNGNITRHFPDASWQAEKLEKTGEEVPLSFSYELDDAPEYECFVFVASKKEFDFSDIENLDKQSLSE